MQNADQDAPHQKRPRQNAQHDGDTQVSIGLGDYVHLQRVQAVAEFQACSTSNAADIEVARLQAKKARELQSFMKWQP